MELKSQWENCQVILNTKSVDNRTDSYGGGKKLKSMSISNIPKIRSRYIALLVSVEGMPTGIGWSKRMMSQNRGERCFLLPAVANKQTGGSRGVNLQMGKREKRV